MHAHLGPTLYIPMPYIRHNYQASEKQCHEKKITEKETWMDYNPGGLRKGYRPIE